MMRHQCVLGNAFVIGCIVGHYLRINNGFTFQDSGFRAAMRIVPCYSSFKFQILVSGFRCFRFHVFHVSGEVSLSWNFCVLELFTIKTAFFKRLDEARDGLT